MSIGRRRRRADRRGRRRRRGRGAGGRRQRPARPRRPHRRPRRDARGREPAGRRDAAARADPVAQLEADRSSRGTADRRTAWRVGHVGGGRDGRTMSGVSHPLSARRRRSSPRTVPLSRRLRTPRAPTRTSSRRAPTARASRRRRSAWSTCSARATAERALRPNADLGRSAAAHSEDMVSENYFDHTSPAGETPLDSDQGQHLPAAAGRAYMVGENIALGTMQLATPAAIVASWMKSPDHRANILNPDFRDSGIGVVARAPQQVRARPARRDLHAAVRRRRHGADARLTLGSSSARRGRRGWRR